MSALKTKTLCAANKLLRCKICNNLNRKICIQPIQAQSSHVVIRLTDFVVGFCTYTPQNNFELSLHRLSSTLVIASLRFVVVDI